MNEEQTILEVAGKIIESIREPPAGDFDIDSLFERIPSPPRKPNSITCPHCHKDFEPEPQI